MREFGFIYISVLLKRKSMHGTSILIERGVPKDVPCMGIHEKVRLYILSFAYLLYVLNGQKPFTAVQNSLQSAHPIYLFELLIRICLCA